MNRQSSDKYHLLYGEHSVATGTDQVLQQYRLMK